MLDQTRMRKVQGRDGLLGWIDPKEQSADASEVLIRMENGQTVLVPADILALHDDDSYYLPLSNDQFAIDRQVQGDHGSDQETLMVIPVLVEKLKVEKDISTQRVRITKHVHKHQEQVKQAGFHENIKVERVVVNKEVTEAPPIRSEGNTTIIPLLEEVLIIEKKMIVREEVHLTLEQIPNEPAQVTLRSEELDVQRLENETDVQEQVKH